MGRGVAALFNSATAPTGAAAFVGIVICGSAVAQGTSQPGHIPDAVAAKGEIVLLSVHAEGAQVYDCKAGEAAA